MNFSSVSGKNWLFKKFNSSDVTKFSESFSLSEIVSRLLSIRKKNIDDVGLFLNPKIKNLLPNPLQLKDMETAVERTYKCILNHESIGIFGDYDVDGASSTALLARYFLSINKKVKTYIPDRQKDGYGPNNTAFKNLIDNGSKVIFTVDCGTLSFEPISLAQKLNVDVIVLDHHQSDIKLPDACAIVNPNHTIGYFIHNRDNLKVHMPNHTLTENLAKDYNAENIDSHPNLEGQQLISERYMECLKKYY